MVDVCKKNPTISNANIPKLLFIIGFPLIITSFTSGCSNILKSLILSNLNIKSFTAISILGPANTFTSMFSFGIIAGCRSLVSKAYGQTNEYRYNRIFTTCLCLSIIGFLCSFAFVFLLGKPFIRIYTNDVQTIGLAYQYLKLSLISLFISYISGLISAVFVCFGHVKIVFFTSTINIIISLSLSYILILGKFGFPVMDITGYALSGIIASLISFIINLIYLFIGRLELSIRLRICRPSHSIAKSILKIAVPVIMSSLVCIALVAGFNYIIKQFDESYITVYGIFSQLNGFIMTLSIGTAAASIAGYNVGRHNKKNIKRTIKCAMIYTLTVNIISVVILWMFTSMFLRIFTSNNTIISLGDIMIKLLSLYIIPMSVINVLADIYNSFGDSIIKLISLVVQTFFTLFLAYILMPFGPLWSISSFFIAEYITFIFIMVYHNKHKSKYY